MHPPSPTEPRYQLGSTKTWGIVLAPKEAGTGADRDVRALSDHFRGGLERDGPVPVAKRQQIDACRRHAPRSLEEPRGP